MSIQKPQTVWEGIQHSVLVAQTRPLRLILALLNFLYPIQLWARRDDAVYQTLINSMPTAFPIVMWSALFVFNGIYLVKGLSGEYNVKTLMLEGVLGWSLWTWTAVVLSSSQGSPHASLISAIVMTWILWRYPTHYTQWGRRDD